MTGTTPAHAIARIRPGTDEAEQLARSAYDRLIVFLRDLRPHDWHRVTVCEDWDVADMVRHLVGAAKGYASAVEPARQVLHGLRHRNEHDGSYLDALNHLQVIEHRHLAPGDELVRELERLAPKAVRGRMRIPSALRRIPLAVPGSGSTPEAAPPRLTVGELTAVTGTRDVWLHHTDIARATGRELDLDPQVDGRIVEDVVAEWARRHGHPFDLTLTGPAGGHYVHGDAGPALQLDPIEFCWILSGRSDVDPTRHGQDLLTTTLLF